MSRREGAAARLYRALVALYPPAFRRRFGASMVADFQELVVAEGAARAWVRALRDAAGALPRAWLRAGRAGAGGAAPRTLLRELRLATRALRRDPAFALPAAAVLALAMGAATAVVGVVDAYLLRPLPFPEADRLVDVEPALPLGLDEARAVFEIPLTWELDAFTLVGDGAPEQVLGSWVPPGWFEAYGVTPALGRAFRPGESGEGAPALAVISHALWQRRFGGDPGVLGRTLRTYSSDRPDDTEVFTVIGVLPRGLWLHHDYADVLVPLRRPNDLYAGRLRADIPLERAETLLGEMARERVPELAGGGRVTLTPLGEVYTDRVRPALTLLATAVLVVLLVAWGNVALLFVVRARRRGREMAVRRALGAGTGAVATHLVAEGLVLAAVAGAGAAAVATLALELLGSVVPARLGLAVPGGPGALALHGGVLAALAATSTAVGLACGLLPLAGEARRRGFAPGHEGGRGGGSVAARRVQGAVMAGELALSLALGVAAVLAVRSALHVATTDLGFEPEGLVTAGLMLRERSYPDPADRVAFHDRLSEALDALPGVAASGIAVREPLGRRYAPRRVEAEGRPTPAGVAGLLAEPQVAGPGYLEVLGLAPVRGRDFGPGDRLGTERVALVSAGLARTLWPDLDPLGRRFREGGSDAPWRTVVGVVPDVLQDPLADPRGDYYLPMAQEAPRYVTVFLRVRPGAASPLPALKEAVAALDPEVAVPDAGDVGARARDIGGPGRFLAFLLAVFGAFAVMLAAVGLYGTVAYAAAQRRRDVAVRMALGARRGQVARLFLRERLPAVAAGVALGLGGAAILARLLEGQLRGVSPWDPATYAAGAVALAAVALGAVWVPARRAERGEPMRVLRDD